MGSINQRIPMKSLLLTTATLLSTTFHAEETMKTLHHLEACYETLNPASENRSEAFAWFSGLPHPLFNAIMHLECKNLSSKLDKLIDQGRSKGPLSVWAPVGDQRLIDALTTRNFTPIGTCPLMKWSVQSIPQQPE